jgi:hypothetical protein
MLRNLTVCSTFVLETHGMDAQKGNPADEHVDQRSGGSFSKRLLRRSHAQSVVPCVDPRKSQIGLLANRVRKNKKARGFPTHRENKHVIKCFLDQGRIS